jgi:stringent starvation protein B
MSTSQSMLSNRPYLLRAFYQWIVDSGCTPILVVDANHPQCSIPVEFAEGGEIVFNISPNAVRDFQISNTQIEFRASFSGVGHFIFASVNSILAVYAEENGEGLFLDAEDEEEVVAKPERAHLRSIEGSNAEPLEGYAIDPSIPTTPKQKPFLKLVE